MTFFLSILGVDGPQPGAPSAQPPARGISGLTNLISGYLQRKVQRYLSSPRCPPNSRKALERWAFVNAFVAF